MTPARQPQHCDHECVCKEYREWYEHVARVIDESCPGIMDCPHDTRPHTTAPAPTDHPLTEEQLAFIIKCERAEAAKAARERVLKEIWDWMFSKEGGNIQKGKTIGWFIPKAFNMMGLIKKLESLRAQQEGRR